MSQYIYILLSIFSYSLFFICAILFKFGKGETPMSSFNKKHFQYSLTYFVLVSISRIYIASDFNFDTIIEIIIGLFLYFGLHYAVFLNFFALAQRSISSSVILLLTQNNNSLSFKDIFKKYAAGKSFSHIKEDRLKDMKQLNWIKQENENIHLTSKGKQTIKIVNLFLKIWGLKQVGK